MGVKQRGLKRRGGATRQVVIVHFRKDRRPEKPDTGNKKARTVSVRALKHNQPLFLVDPDSACRSSFPAHERTALCYSHDHRHVTRAS